MIALIILGLIVGLLLIGAGKANYGGVGGQGVLLLGYVITFIFVLFLFGEFLI